MNIYTGLDIVNTSFMKNDPDEMAVYFVLLVEIRTHAKFSHDVTKNLEFIIALNDMKRKNLKW